MLTILSGVPGTGKTAKIVEMIMEDLRAGKKVFTIGIPGLMLDAHQGGNPHEWQNGTWLKIDHYNPDLTRRLGMQGEWFPRSCDRSCQFLSTCPRNFTPPADAGAVIYIDEAHVSFPQRPSGREPPPHVQALTVHRHQGLDFVFITQRPQFLDPFVRGLASKHIHIALSAFSMFGERAMYEWPEYQENINRTARLLAAKSKYKPAPHVFPLYKSATIHTKLDQRMPTALKMIFGMFAFALLFSVWFYDRASQRYASTQTAQTVQSPHKAVPAVLDLQEASKPIQRPFGSPLAVADAPAPESSADYPPEIVPAPSTVSYPAVDSCLASGDYCRCYSNGHRVPMDASTCQTIVNGGWIRGRQIDA